VPTSPLAAIGNQLKIAGPGAFFLWPLGAIWLLASRQGKRWRFAGVTFLLLFVMMIASGSSRPDRIAGIYPLLFAAGAVALESWAAERRLMRWAPRCSSARRRLRRASGAAVSAVPTAARYAQATGLVPQIERGKTSPLPQPLADRTGGLSRGRCAARIRRASRGRQGRRPHPCSSYGTAGALELLGAWRSAAGDRDPQRLLVVGSW
jgi:hypothetical protein